MEESSDVSEKTERDDSGRMDDTLVGTDMALIVNVFLVKLSGGGSF